MFKQIGMALDKLSAELNIMKESLMEQIYLDDDETLRINLSHLNLRRIPEAIQLFPNIKSLDLSHNQLDELDSFLFNIISIEELNISYNKFRILDLGIADMENLKQLDISHNSIVNIPKRLSDLSRLQRLIGSHNKLSEFHLEFSKFQDLEYLDLSSNVLIIAPTCIQYMQLLNYINLANNQIRECNLDFSMMYEVQEFDISGNMLNSFKIEIDKAPKLKKLNLSRNPLNELPHSFPEILEELDIVKTSLREYPTGIFEVAHVKSDIGPIMNQLHSQFHNFKIDFLLETKMMEVNFDTLNLYSRLKSDSRGFVRFDLSDLDLEAIPKSIFLLTSLRELDLHGNKIKKIPDDILKMKKLQKLDLASNQIEEFQFDLSALSSLRILSLSKNKLEIFPIPSKYSFIKELSLQYNKIKKISNSIKNFVELQTLRIDNNPIISYSGELSKIRSLKKLIIDEEQEKYLKENQLIVFHQLTGKISLLDV